MNSEWDAELPDWCTVQNIDSWNRKGRDFWSIEFLLLNTSIERQVAVIKRLLLQGWSNVTFVRDVTDDVEQCSLSVTTSIGWTLEDAGGKLRGAITEELR